MEIELEKTFLLKYMPEEAKNCKAVEIIDIYIPANIEHPILRIRKSGDKYEITKKEPVTGTDSSEQSEITIPLSKEEFEVLSLIEGKRFRKIRYYYPFGKLTAEIDVYKDDLEGLVIVDFEFEKVKEKNAFKMPEFCLADITQEKFCAGGILAGKRYGDVERFLKPYGYKRQKVD